MDPCIFCRIADKSTPADVVYEDQHYLAFLDKYPQSPGQLQFIPKKHYRWIYEVPQMGEMFTIAQKIIRAIIPVLGASHVTLATFGQQVGHAHLWIVPQYGGGIRLKEKLGQGQRSDRRELTTKIREAIEKEVFV